MPKKTVSRQRSYNMSRIRSKGNESTELRMVSLLKSLAITGWRRHLPLPGKPDFYFPTRRVAIFVDGCFWHACPKCNFRPKANKLFWEKKLRGNSLRDKRINRILRSKEILVIRIWEHQLKSLNRSTIKKLERVLSENVFGPERGSQ